MAEPNTIPDWLAVDRAWLIEQPGMPSWPKSAARIRDRVESWINRYRSELKLSGSNNDTASKLWRCWLHHWRTAIEKNGKAADGFEVASRIEAGRGYRSGGNLGGNVIRDVVLANAMLAKDNDAIRRFEIEYQATITRQVEAVRSLARNDPTWWNELLGALVGVKSADREGRLARFCGRSALTPWVVTVAIRFLSDRAAGLRQHEALDPALPDLEAGTDGAIRTAISANCVELLAGRIRQALALLRTRESLALKLLAVDGLQGQEIAAVFGINPGNVSRLLQTARESLFEKLSSQEAHADENRECFEALLEAGDGCTLAESLRTALAELAHERLP